MAGGDGSQALVASVASRHGIPMVVIPAGTRNHFALDLGMDRADVVGALDAYDDGVDRRIDLAEVNGRTFVNNASMGLYAQDRAVAGVPRRQAAHGGRDAARPDRAGRGAARPAVHPAVGRAGHVGQPRARVEQPLPALAPARRVHAAAPRQRRARGRVGARARRRGCREVRRARGRRPGRPVRRLERVDGDRVRGDVRRTGRGRRRRRGPDAWTRRCASSSGPVPSPCGWPRAVLSRRVAAPAVHVASAPTLARPVAAPPSAGRRWRR